MDSVFYRKIVDMENWDGAQANYSDAISFARSSLVNFNEVAGRSASDTWVKSLIKLPVRRESDETDTFVRQAIYNAASRLANITRPDDVDEDAFEFIITNAVQEIVLLYDEMGEEVPEQIMELAKQNRAKSMFSIWDRLYDAIYLADLAEETYTYLVDIYIDERGMFALGIRDGEIVRIDIVIDGDTILLSDIQVLDVMDSESRTKTIVTREANGRFRWLVIAATTALNRSGQIDSKSLFQSFVETIEHTKDYPILNFYHQSDRSRLGVADYVAHDENVYIATGLFDDNKFGRAAAKGLEANEGLFGNSIEFFPLEGELVKVEAEKGTFIEIPVFTRGVNTAISILPEKDAAALFTYHTQPNMEERSMDGKVKTALKALFQSEPELVDEFEAIVDRTNVDVRKRIHRSTEEVVEDEIADAEEVEEEIEEVVEGEVVEEEEEEVEEEEEEEELETVVELDESVIPDLAEALFGNPDFLRAIQDVARQTGVQTNEVLENLIVKMADQTKTWSAERAALEARVSAMEAIAEQGGTEWEDDKPQTRRVRKVTYRASDAAVETDEAPKSFTATANDTLAKLYTKSGV